MYIRNLRIEQHQAARMKVEKLKMLLKNLTRRYIEATEAYSHLTEEVNAAHRLVAQMQENQVA